MIRHQMSGEGVAELVIDNPPANALNLADIAELVRLLRSYQTDGRVRVVLLRADGRGFCGGGDVKEVQRLSGFHGILGQANGSQELTLAIDECPVPVIAAIHGYCIGLGVLVAGVCDIILAAEQTRFVLAEADNGATSGIVQAAGLLPEKRLQAAMYTCDPFFAEALHSYGSVYRVVPLSELADAARAVAAQIAAKRTPVIRGIKSAVKGTIGRDIRKAYRRELSYTLELNMSGEARDAREEFIDGRRRGYRHGNEIQ